MCQGRRLEDQDCSRTTGPDGRDLDLRVVPVPPRSALVPKWSRTPDRRIYSMIHTVNGKNPADLGSTLANGVLVLRRDDRIRTCDPLTPRACDPVDQGCYQRQQRRSASHNSHHGHRSAVFRTTTRTTTEINFELTRSIQSEQRTARTRRRSGQIPSARGPVRQSIHQPWSRPWNELPNHSSAVPNVDRVARGGQHRSWPAPVHCPSDGDAVTPKHWVRV